MIEIDKKCLRCANRKSSMQLVHIYSELMHVTDILETFITDNISDDSVRCWIERKENLN